LIQKHLDIDDEKKEDEQEQTKPIANQQKTQTNGNVGSGMLIVKEDRSQGNVGFSMYLKYVRYGGGLFAGILLAITFVLLQVHRVINDVRQ